MNETTQDVARPNPLSTSRRVFLGGVGLAAGLAATRGRNWLGEDLTKYRFDDLFTLFEQSLSQTQRAHTFLSSDHPIRQVTLTEAAHRSPHIATLYNSFQVDLIRQMYGSMLSAQGRRWMQNTISLEGRFEGSIFKIYSDNLNNASAQNSQVVINGGHFMLRSNDLPSSGYALGGPIAYGQQLGNNQYKVEGNAFKAHGDALDLFHRALNKDERTIAYQQSPPNELLLQIQGHDSIFPGIRIGDTSDAAKELAREMLATLFEGFTANQQSDAWSAVNDNGGIESLHVAM